MSATTCLVSIDLATSVAVWEGQCTTCASSAVAFCSTSIPSCKGTNNAAIVTWEPHVILLNLLPPSTDYSLTSSIPPVEDVLGNLFEGAKSGNVDLDLACLLASSDKFSTLVDILKVMRLAGILDDYSSLTVFAPTESAILLSCLQRPENRATLISTLMYHLVKGKHLFSTNCKLASDAVLPSMQGKILTVTIAINTTHPFSIQMAQVLLPHIIASNGVVHRINAGKWKLNVLFP